MIVIALLMSFPSKSHRRAHMGHAKHQQPHNHQGADDRLHGYLLTSRRIAVLLCWAVREKESPYAIAQIGQCENGGEQKKLVSCRSHWLRPPHWRQPQPGQ